MTHENGKFARISPGFLAIVVVSQSFVVFLYNGHVFLTGVFLHFCHMEKDPVKAKKRHIAKRKKKDFSSGLFAMRSCQQLQKSRRQTEKSTTLFGEKTILTFLPGRV